MFSNTTGADIVAVGKGSLRANVSSNANVAVGSGALAKVRGPRNIALGKDAGTNVNGVRSDNIEIGNKGAGTDSATIRIGTQGTHTKAFMAGISGTPVTGPAQFVVVNSAGNWGPPSQQRRPTSKVSRRRSSAG